MKENKPVRILLVEDERTTRQAIQKALLQYGYACHSAETLSEATELIRKESFDLVMSDVRLPDGTGLELLDAMRRILLDMPFVVITASERRTLIKEAYKRGATDYLTKPFNLTNLPTVIERNLERKHIEHELSSPKKPTVLLKAIESLIAALEAKDSYTSGHSLRVAGYARRLGVALNLDENDIFTLELSAILHDIGKIGMPDHILKKSGSLLEAEYDQAREHPVVGSTIVGKIDELREVAAIIRHHHERFDGSGYPDGLRGEVIPYFSRILSLADAFESQVSARVYRKPLSPEKALEELEKNAGNQFDPGLVAVFTSMMRSENLAPETEFQFDKEVQSGISESADSDDDSASAPSRNDL
jgi:putative two-component system response regulator